MAKGVYRMDRKALSAAFPVTVPVLMGYLAIGYDAVKEIGRAHV